MTWEAHACPRAIDRRHGDPVTSWVNPTSLLGGVLALFVCAFVAAVFLTAEARRRELPGRAAGW